MSVGRLCRASRGFEPRESCPRADESNLLVSGISAGDPPKEGDFVCILSRHRGDWYTLATFIIDVKNDEDVHLDEIRRLYEPHGYMRCYMEVYKRLHDADKLPTWNDIAICLRRVRDHRLAKMITSKVNGSVPLPISESHNELVLKVPPHVLTDYITLKREFVKVNIEFRKVFMASEPDINELRWSINKLVKVSPLPEDRRQHRTATEIQRMLFELVDCISQSLDVEILIVLANGLLPTSEKEPALVHKLNKFKNDLKLLPAQVKDLVELLQNNAMSDDCRTVKLKVREYWGDFFFNQFETAMHKLFPKLYQCKSQLCVRRGCFIFSWTIPSTSEATVPQYSHEFLKLIGVLSLQVGDDVLYDLTNETGCDVLEAAMIQAFKLRNVQAIEFLVLMGCNPEVATYSGDNTFMNVEPISEKIIYLHTYSIKICLCCRS